MAKLKVYVKNNQTEVKVPVGIRLLIRRCCQAVLTTEKFGKDAEVSVSFVSNKEIKELKAKEVPHYFLKSIKIVFSFKGPQLKKKKEVHSPQTKEIFHKEYLYKLDMTGIINNTNENEELYNEEALADMNAATSVFVPIINENDDPLKKLIKQAIIDKKIDINRLKHKMPQKYGLTNMKSALIGKTKMSISNFNIWCELLGISYYIELGNNGTDDINPLPHPISFSSEDGIGQ